MSMSKRDYENVARVMRYHRELCAVDVNAVEIIDDIIADLGTAFASANERFDPRRFSDACGVQR